MATTRGRIRAISISSKKGTKKTNVPSAKLRVDWGIERDAHAGRWHRQVSLLAAEAVEQAGGDDADIAPGDFAENITTEEIDLCGLNVGDRLRLGAEAEIEITQFGKTCHSGCEIYRILGDCIMPRLGVFARVVKGGVIRCGDAIEVIGDDDKSGDCDRQ